MKVIQEEDVALILPLHRIMLEPTVMSKLGSHIYGLELQGLKTEIHADTNQQLPMKTVEIDKYDDWNSWKMTLWQTVS